MPLLSQKLLGLSAGRVGFWCPGCDEMHVIYVEGPKAWGYNGNPDQPTFTPSVLVSGIYAEPPVTSENMDEYRRSPWPQTKVQRVCHSFVTDGTIQFLSDCTHAMAGQTVQIPDLPDRAKEF